MGKASDAAEAAWVEFEAADVGALGPLCLTFANDLDNEAFQKVQQRARTGKGKAREKAIDELTEIAARHRSPMLHDGVLAGALDGIEDYERALAVRLETLPFTPSWHPTLAGQVVGNVGWTLQRLGEPAAARLFFERALRFDPTNPFVLGSLAELAVEEGDPAWARGVRAWLSEHGFPAELHAETLDALLKKASGADSRPYSPGFDGLRRLSARDWARLLACVEADRDAGPHATLRALALGATMRGESARARLFADEALQLEQHGVEGSPNDVAWAKAMAVWLATSGPSAETDPGTRAVLFDEATERRDLAAMRPMLCDPIPALRTIAAEEIADPDALVLLEELAATEHALGIAARPPSAHGAAYALYRLRAKSLGKQPLAVLAASPGGVTSAKLGKTEGLVFWLTFSQKISQEDALWIDANLQKAASRMLAEKDPKVAVYTAQNPQTFQLVLSGGKFPAANALAVIETFCREDSRLAELVYGRYSIPDGKKRHLFQPVRSPDSKQEETEDTWEQAFDFSRPPPLSEPDEGPSFMMMQSDEGNVPEVRLAPVELPEARVVWGLEGVDQRELGAGTKEGEREVELRRIIDAALARAFRGQPPPRSNRKGETDGSLDGIRCRGRDGFAFAVDGMCPEFVVHYPCGFRFREHEILGALAQVTATAALVPVVHWERSRGTWIFNLWC
ncbi:MAG: hypothetical protein U0263_27730 [Polyangiaceae bacterium]